MSDIRYTVYIDDRALDAGILDIDTIERVYRYSVKHPNRVILFLCDNGRYYHISLG
jgi:hypothetical protein